MKQKRREGKERKEGIKEGKYDGKVRERRKKRERQGKTEEGNISRMAQSVEASVLADGGE